MVIQAINTNFSATLSFGRHVDANLLILSCFKCIYIHSLYLLNQHSGFVQITNVMYFQSPCYLKKLTVSNIFD